MIEQPDTTKLTTGDVCQQVVQEMCDMINNTRRPTLRANTVGGCVPEVNMPSLGDQLWMVDGTNYIPCKTTTNKLPAGYYNIKTSPNWGVYFVRQPLNVDDLMILPDSASERIVKHINEFWQSEKYFREHGFLWKRGTIIYGPPGGGKSSTIQIVAKNIIEQDGLIISVTSPPVGTVGLQALRLIEPQRRLIVILEDIDAITHQYGETELLALLDGEQQIDNIFFIATTNYPERLDPRIINRPSRFDMVEKIGMPNAESRRLFLQAKSKFLAQNKSTLSKWVEDTEEFSLAYLKELIVAVEIFKTPYEAALLRLKTMLECRSNSNEFQKPIIGLHNLINR